MLKSPLVQRKKGTGVHYSPINGIRRWKSTHQVVFNQAFDLMNFRYHRVPMTAMDIAGIEERIEKGENVFVLITKSILEIHKKEVLTAEFEKKRTENEDRERLERQRMQVK